MTEYYVDPEDVIVDFLRRRLTDPQARAEATDSDSFTATAGQTSFTLTPSSGTVSCVTSVTVDSVSKTKWRDYFWDYQNQKIIFYTGLTVGQAVVVNYKYGSSNWIFADRPNEKLSSTSWPRIEVFALSNTGRRLGNYEADVAGTIVFQINCWAKDGVVVTIGNNKYANNYLSRYLGNKIGAAFEDYEDDLYPVLFNYEAVSLPKAGPYSEEYMAYNTILEIRMQGISLGRIVK